MFNLQYYEDKKKNLDIVKFQQLKDKTLNKLLNYVAQGVEISNEFNQARQDINNEIAEINKLIEENKKMEDETQSEAPADQAEESAESTESTETAEEGGTEAVQ